MIRIYNDKPEQVISFFRQKENHIVIPVINFSDKTQTVQLKSVYPKGTYKELFTEKEYALTGNDTFEIEAWAYLVLYRMN